MHERESNGFANEAMTFLCFSLAYSLNLDMPLVDILDTAQQNGELRFTRYTRDDWAAQLEIFAPGYLALERQGLEMNYDLANLWSDLQGYQHWVPPGKYPPGARRREHGQ